MNPRNWPPYTCQLRVVSPAEFATVRATPGQAGNLNPGSMFAVMNGSAFVALWGKFANGNQPGDFSLVVPNNLSTPYWVFVSSLADLPTAVGGVITLFDGVTYVFTTQVDLAGARIVAGINTTILGGSSESCRILSTGLVGSALITSQWSLPMRNVSLEADIALDLDAAANPNSALDWFGVNFVNCGSVGTIANYSTVNLSDCSITDSGGVTFDGTINTVSFSQCSLKPAIGSAAVTVAATANIVRRLIIIYSSFSVLAAATGISVPVVGAIAQPESFILDSVDFSGAGTYLTGITQANNEALFVGCTGVQNSAAVASYFMVGNAVATNLTNQGQFYKVAGATAAGIGGSQFSVSNNRATFIGARTGIFKMQAVMTITDGNNQNVSLRFAVNGVTIPSTQSDTNTDTGGRSQNVTVQGIATLSTGQYVELWAANNSSPAATLTAVDLNVIVSRFD